MKKYLLTLIVAIAGCMAAMAGDDIKLTSGSIASLKDGCVGCVTIDMAETTFDNKKPLRRDERFANIDQDIPE